MENEKIKKLELELEDVESARDRLVTYSQWLFNKLLELEDELDKKNRNYWRNERRQRDHL